VRQRTLHTIGFAALILATLAVGALSGCGPDNLYPGYDAGAPPSQIQGLPGDAPNQNRPGAVPPAKNPLEGIDHPLGHYNPGNGSVDY
jgi:hypothetical protein